MISGMVTSFVPLQTACSIWYYGQLSACVTNKWMVCWDSHPSHSASTSSLHPLLMLSNLHVCLDLEPSHPGSMSCSPHVFAVIVFCIFLPHVSLLLTRKLFFSTFSLTHEWVAKKVVLTTSK
ncbi:hypothetical protein XENOCAPTIV_015496 [Xenoophorus captivus]|uniref:Uncharacterized protein n=1 Tax=Xenoophorus captivus TaxID=1517983 RepID=A0ABV0RAS2_9TELE